MATKEHKEHNSRIFRFCALCGLSWQLTVVAAQAALWGAVAKSAWVMWSRFLKVEISSIYPSEIHGLAALAPPEMSSGGRSAATPKFQISLASVKQMMTVLVPLPGMAMV
jgi:hypothetical protein